MVASVFVAVVFMKSMDESNFPHDQVVEKADSILSSPVLSVNADDTFPSIGPKNAPVTIVEFSDFQCPFCRLGAFTMNTIQNRYPDKVRLVFRNFPLNSACNPSLDHVVHEFACDTAKAAVCAERQGKFDPGLRVVLREPDFVRNRNEARPAGHRRRRERGQPACVHGLARRRDGDRARHGGRLASRRAVHADVLHQRA